MAQRACHATYCIFMSCNAYHQTSCNVTLWNVIASDVMSRCMMLCYVTVSCIISYLTFHPFSSPSPITLHLSPFPLTPNPFPSPVTLSLHRFPCAQRPPSLWGHADNSVWGFFPTAACGSGQQEPFLLRLRCVAISLG